MMCDEPKDGELALIAANDLQEEKSVTYTVVEVTTEKTVQTGEFTIAANASECIAKLPDKKGAFYLISWESEGKKGVNHFVCNIGEGWTYEKYKECMQKAGFYEEFEGF